MSGKRVLVTGGGGFIGSHLARRLKSEGHWVRIADWKQCEYFKPEEICHEFVELDLRDLENCSKACDGVEWVFNLAADMGDM
jgi:nucleoside-diphosphate-sugar epimerase